PSSAGRRGRMSRITKSTGGMSRRSNGGPRPRPRPKGGGQKKGGGAGGGVFGLCGEGQRGHGGEAREGRELCAARGGERVRGGRARPDTVGIAPRAPSAGRQPLMSLAETPIAALAAVPAVAPEYHYSIPEIAGILKLSTQTVIGYFENEPGVVRVSAARQRF